jgi:hypothetical protein
MPISHAQLTPALRLHPKLQEGAMELVVVIVVLVVAGAMIPGNPDIHFYR